MVQAMVRPVVAGVAFTVNPVTGVHDELVISAPWGLGEALVSGRVDPDKFIMRKADSTVLSSRVGSKQHRVVSENGVSRLVETGERERARPTLAHAQRRNSRPPARALPRSRSCGAHLLHRLSGAGIGARPHRSGFLWATVLQPLPAASHQCRRGTAGRRRTASDGAWGRDQPEYEVAPRRTPREYTGFEETGGTNRFIPRVWGQRSTFSQSRYLYRNNLVCSRPP